jgi:hypothetical protein
MDLEPHALSNPSTMTFYCWARDPIDTRGRLFHEHELAYGQLLLETGGPNQYLIIHHDLLLESAQ